MDWENTCRPGSPFRATCQEGCPAGTVESWKLYGAPHCESQREYRSFCCPIVGRPDRCGPRIDLQKFTRQACSGRCSGSEVKIGTSVLGCLTGWNEVCCTRSDALTAMQQCGTYHWVSCYSTLTTITDLLQNGQRAAPSGGMSKREAQSNHNKCIRRWRHAMCRVESDKIALLQ